MVEAAGEDFSILLVEDDPDQLDLVTQSLKGARSIPYRIDHARTLNEALDKIEKRTYHLVLVEEELSETPGHKLLEAIQEKKLKLPVVLMTSTRDDKMVRQMMERGASDLIVKSENSYHELSEKLMLSYEKFYKTHLKRRAADVEEWAELAPGSSLQVIKDDLTGLYNHSHLHDRVVREFSRSNRYHYPLSCLILDIDYFRKINEEKGYRIGDELLREVAKLLFDSCRLSDFVARYGGEEFAVLMPHIDYDGAARLANRLRATFAEHVFLPNSERIHLTVSIGVSSYPDDNMELRSEILSFSSQALIQAKVEGRNCVCLFRDSVPTLGTEISPLKVSTDHIAKFQQRLIEIAGHARRQFINASKKIVVDLEGRDRFTAGHSQSCATYAVQVAQTMGLSLDDAEVVEHAALLHDIGKIFLSENLLTKDGQLSFEEFEAMKQHTELGYKILKPVPFLQREALIVLHHHEWYNGQGYPARIKGEEIPMGARIISAVDAYDTMHIAGGRYKKTYSVKDAVGELVSYAGHQFDPVVVKAFIQVLIHRGELEADEYDKEMLDRALQKKL